ncbi:hypothetical protein EDB86DRAFT_2831323 [Lactarius hatsudake]|nr:hypothetical protein EDB86DRAFT_2831323 [Lactarius hatsudake]
MEQHNPFAVLADTPPSPTLHAPTPSLHAAPPPPAFMSARDTVILGAVADEVYVPTPTPLAPEHPLPSPVESLNNSTLIPSQTPEGMVAVAAGTAPPPNALVAPGSPSPSPEQIATIGANILAQLNALEASPSYHPSTASNLLDHTDDPDYLEVLDRLLNTPAAAVRTALDMLPNPSPRLVANLAAAYRSQAMAHIQGSAPTSYASPSSSHIAAFLTAHTQLPHASPEVLTGSHAPPTLEWAELEADCLLDIWLAFEALTLLAPVRDRYRCDFICGTDRFHPAIWELTCWVHLVPVDQLDDFFHCHFPSRDLLRMLREAFSVRVANLHHDPLHHSLHAQRVAIYITHRLGDPEGSDAEITTQELLQRAAPTPILTVSLSQRPISISSDSVEEISGRAFQGPIRTPSRVHRHCPLSRQPSVSTVAAAALGAPDELSSGPSSEGDTPPQVTWAGSSQTQEAIAALDELRELASLPRFPREVLQGLPGGPHQDARDLVNLMNLVRIGYGLYLQTANLAPLKEGVQIGT